MLDADACLTLEADLIGLDAMHLKLQCEGALLGGAPRVDGTAVTRAGTAALQVLAATARDAERTGRSLTWLGASEALIEAAALLGLLQALGLDKLARGA